MIHLSTSQSDRHRGRVETRYIGHKISMPGTGSNLKRSQERVPSEDDDNPFLVDRKVVAESTDRRSPRKKYVILFDVTSYSSLS